MKSNATTIYLRTVLFAAVVLFASEVIAESGGNNVAIKPGEPVNGLRMEARARLIDHEGEKQLVIHAYLLNEGSDNVTVLTEEIGPSLGRDATGLVIGFSYTARQERDGRLIIPSLVPNEPVTLRPGEVSLLFARLVSERFVDPLEVGEEIRVGYFVLEEWGDRFDIWHGYVCVDIPVQSVPSD